MESLGLHFKPNVQVHPGHKLTGLKEEEEEEEVYPVCARLLQTGGNA
jgi:hypothetical protein